MYEEIEDFGCLYDYLPKYIKPADDLNTEFSILELARALDTVIEEVSITPGLLIAAATANGIHGDYPPFRSQNWHLYASKKSLRRLMQTYYREKCTGLRLYAKDKPVKPYKRRDHKLQYNSQ